MVAFHILLSFSNPESHTDYVLPAILLPDGDFLT